MQVCFKWYHLHTYFMEIVLKLFAVTFVLIISSLIHKMLIRIPV